MMKAISIRSEYICKAIAKYPPVCLALSLLVGNIVSDLTDMTIIVVLMGLCGLLLFHKSKWNLIFFCLGLALSQITTRQISEIGPTHIGSYLDREVIISGVVVSYPYPKNNYLYFNFQAEKIFLLESEQEQAITAGLLKINVDSLTRIEKGYRLQFKARIKKPPTFEGFDYNEYLKSSNIYGLISKPEDLQIHTVGEGSFNLVGKLVAMRAEVFARIRNLLPEPHVSLLLGILIGSREEFSEEFAGQLSNTGTSHIIAVSGYNVSILVSTLLLLAGYLPRRALILLAYLVLTLFLFLVGTDNLPALRAVIMTMVVLFAEVLGRRSSVYSLLALAVAFMLLQNPYIYKSLSFQLSFAATLGLVILANDVQNLMPKLLGEQLRGELGTTMTAIISTFPVTFQKFGKLAIWSPATNILVAPLVPLIMLLGAFLTIATFASQSVASFLAIIIWALLEIMVQIITRAGELPGADLAINKHLAEITYLYLLTLAFLVFKYKCKPVQL